MANNASLTPGKETIDNLLPVLFAALGPDVVGFPIYNKMVALNPAGRSAQGYYHYFRGFKDKAKALLAAQNGNAGGSTDAVKEKKAAKATNGRKRKATMVDDGGAEAGNDYGEDTAAHDGKVVKSRKRNVKAVKETAKEETKEETESDDEKVKEEGSETV